MSSPSPRIKFSAAHNSVNVLIQERLANIFIKKYQLSRQMVERCLLDVKIRNEINRFTSLIVNNAGFELLKPLIFSIKKDKDETKQYIKCDFVPVLRNKEMKNDQAKFLVVHAQPIEQANPATNDVINSLLFSEINLSDPDMFLNSMTYTLSNIYECLARETQINFAQLNNSLDDNGGSNNDNKLNELNVIWNVVSLQVKNIECVDSQIEIAKHHYSKFMAEQIILWNEKVNDYLDQYVKYSKSFLFKYFNTKTKNYDRGPGLELMQWKIEFFFYRSLLKIATNGNVNIAYQNCSDNEVKESFASTLRRLDESSIIAKNKLKCLHSIAVSWQPLYGLSVKRVFESIRRMVQGVARLSTVSTYYKRPEALASLFQKITLQLIDFCQNYWEAKVMPYGKKSSSKMSQRNNKASHEIIDTIWDDENIDKILEYAIVVLNLNKKYIDEFRKIKDHLAAHPSLPQFTFREDVTFSLFFSYNTRVEKLSRILSSCQKIFILKKSNGGAIALPAIETLKKMLHKFKTKCPYFLLKEKVDDVFYKDVCTEYVNKITFCNQRLKNAVEKRVHVSPNCFAGLKFLSQIETLHPFNSNIFKTSIHQCYLHSLEKFQEEIEHMCDIYAGNKNNPPYPRNLPPVAGKIMWARHLTMRLQDPMPYFVKYNSTLSVSNVTTIFATDVGKNVVKGYNRLLTTLSTYEDLWYNGWCDKCDELRVFFYVPLLETTLTKSNKDEKIYTLNLNSNVFQLINDIRIFKNLNIPLPGFATHVWEQKARLQKSFDGLKYVLNEYQIVKRNVPQVLKALVQPAFMGIEDILSDFTTKHTWMSPDIYSNIHSIEKMLSYLKELVGQLNEILQLQVEKNIKKFRSYKILDFDTMNEPTNHNKRNKKSSKKEKKLELPSIDGFIMNAETKIDECSKHLQAVQASTESSILRLFELIQTNIPATKSPQFKEKFDEFIVYYNRKMIMASEHIIFDVLNNFKTHLSSGASASFMFMFSPLFKLKLEYKFPNVILVPNLEKVQQGVNRLARKCINVSKSLHYWSKWNTNGTTESQFTDGHDTLFMHFGKNIKTVKFILQIAGSLVGLQDQVNSYIEKLARYKILWTGFFSTNVDEMKNNVDQISYFSLLPPEQQKDIISNATTPSVKYLEKEFLSLNIIKRDVALIKVVTVIESLAIESSSLKATFKTKLDNGAETVSNALIQSASTQLRALDAFLENALDSIQMQIVSLEELQHVMSQLEALRKLEATIDGQLLPMIETTEILKRLNISGYRNLDYHLQKTLALWQKLQDVSEDTVEELSKIQVKYKQELISKIKEVKENCKRFENDWRNAGPTVGTNDPRLVLRRLINFRTTFDTLQNKIDSIQSGQKLFGIDMLRLENFYTIGKTIAILESLLSIWQVLEKTLRPVDKNLPTN